jgi:hypothetical protein
VLAHDANLPGTYCRLGETQKTTRRRRTDGRFDSDVRAATRSRTDAGTDGTGARRPAEMIRAGTSRAISAGLEAWSPQSYLVNNEKACLVRYLNCHILPNFSV